MGKRSKKRRSQVKLRAKESVVQAPPRRGIFGRIANLLSPTGWLCASVSLMLALIGSYYLFRPQIEVEPDTALNPRQPMTTPFRITNRSVLPIYNVHKECGISELASDQSVNQRFTVSGLTFTDATEPTIPRLDDGESTSVFFHTDRLAVLPGHPIESGDIDVVVEYTTAILRIHKKQIFRFETRKDVNNEVRWYHKSSSE